MTPARPGKVDMLGAAHPSRPRLSNNAAWLLMAQLAVAASGLLVAVAVSRLLGAEQLGRWRFAQAVFAYAVVFTDAGLSALAVREIARDNTATNRYGFPIVVVQLATAALVYGVVVLATQLSDLPGQTKELVAVLGLVVFPFAFSMAHVLQGTERMQLVARVRIGIQGTSSVAGLVLLYITRNLLGLVIPIILANVVASAWIAARVRRDHGVRFALPELPELVQLLREGSPFLFASLSLLLIFNADAILLEVLRGDESLGLYAAAYSIAGQLLTLGGPIMSAVYPRLASTVARDEDGMRLVRPLISVLGLVVLPITLGGAVVSDKLIAFLYGAGYQESVSVLVLLMALPAVGYYNMVLAQSLSASRHQGRVMVVSFLTAGVNVGANVALIPVAGIMGAAVAMLIGEVTAAIAYTVSTHRLFRTVVLVDYLATFPAAAFMAGCVMALRLIFDIQLLPAVAVGAVVYMLTLLAFPTPGSRMAIVWTRARVRR